MKRPIIKFYYDGWQGSRWIRYAFERGAAGILNIPACYVIYLDGALSYIGQTCEMRKRLQTYRICNSDSDGIITPWGIYRSVIIKIRYGTKYGDWAMREARLIYRIQPPLNCVGSIKKRVAA